MAYRVEFTPAAARQLKALPRTVQVRLKPHIDALAGEPWPRGARKLAGQDDIYRIRVGDYRILYIVQEAVLLVLVVKVGHRDDFYRDRAG